MNTPLPLLYTNDASPEFLRSLDQPAFMGERIARFAEELLAIIRKTRPYKAAPSSHWHLPMPPLEAATAVMAA